MSINKAVISAAGMGLRLMPLTEDVPKGMLKIGQKTILERSVELLQQNNIENILIIVGYNRDKIALNINNININYVVNPLYKYSNNLMSLWFAKEWVNDDPFLYLHSDIMYDGRLINKILKEKNSTALVDKGSNDEEAMMVIEHEEGWLEAGKGSAYMKHGCGEWTGIASIYQPKQFFKHAEKILENPDNLQAYDVAAISAHRPLFKIMSTDELPWIEIDFEEDLKKARKIFADVSD